MLASQEDILLFLLDENDRQPLMERETHGYLRY